MFKKLFIITCLFAIGIINAAQITIPEAGWLINNFRDKESGAKLTFEKGPDDNNAMMVDLYGKTNSNISMSQNVIKEQAIAWPQTFTGIKGYFWNDGQMTKLTFAFRIDYENQFVGFVKMDHQGWKLLEISGITNFRNKTMEFNPNKIFSIFFKCDNRKDFKIGLGTMNWEVKGAQLTK